MISYLKKNNYDFDKVEFINEYNNEFNNEFNNKYKFNKYEKIIEELLGLVKKNIIKFPYNKFLIKNPEFLFENLKYANLVVSQEQYKLYSYNPKYKSFLPALFRGEPTSIVSDINYYEHIDILSDYFMEEIRLKTKRNNILYSVDEAWHQEKFLKKIFRQLLQKNRITNRVLRDIITQNIAENKLFNPTWAKALLKTVIGNNLKNKKWLDISAGWGDRLLTAMALDMEYHGFDPNIDLLDGHCQMINMFGNKKKHIIYYKPFEKAILPNVKYDVIFTSPPYFNLEVYAPNQKGQSIVDYPNFDDWMVQFMFASLFKAWNHLKIGGFLILHLGDTKELHLAEPTNIFIQNFLPFASWEGIIGIKGMSGYNRPVWVWKKVNNASSVIHWKSKFPLNLSNTYTKLYQLFLNYNRDIPL
jgi:hypothetical protein